MGQGAARDAQDETAAKADDGGVNDALELDDAVELAEELDLTEYDVEEEGIASPSRLNWVAPTLAIALILGWTGFYGWAIQDQLIAAASAAPGEWARWIIDWSVPVLLVGVGWLLSMRHSRVEANRFAHSAALLSQESRELETRLTVVNRELSLAREFLGTQSLELESLGRIASERLSTHADALQGLIRDNGAQVESIGSASETALTNMKRLRDDLPVIANSARDVSNQVGNAGRTAQEQLEKLVTGFERLNQFGKASENQVNAFDKRVSDILTGFEAQIALVENAISDRLEGVRAETSAFRTGIEESEQTALKMLRESLSTLQSETQTIAGQLRAAETGAMQQLRDTRQRFEIDVAKTVESLDKLDAHAIAASQRRIKELHEEANRFDTKLEVRDRKFMEEMSRRQEEFDTREAQASEVLAQRLSDLDDALSERREAQLQDTERLITHSAAMTEQLDTLSTLIAEIAAQGEAARTGLSSGLGELGDILTQKRSALSETESQLSELTESGIRLLEIIQSGARHSREDFPKAVETASEAMKGVEQRAEAVSGMMLSANEQAASISTYLIETQSRIEGTDTSLDALKAKLAEQSEDALAKLQGLRGSVTRLTKESDGLAEATQSKLREALDLLDSSTKSAFTALEDGATERVVALANGLSKQAVDAIEQSLRAETAEAVEKLEEAASQASGVGRDATVQLRDQLAKVNELTINLEQRIARARELAEEQVGNDFARRMALITDSLNSNSIDIANALSTEVSDTSWDAYLKGDRGIFTRRAVRLVENGDAKEIAELYQSDDAFNANVSRYIHDFEAMLRSMLSTRDGNALGVTILGSDMGKLYVVLAQSIERFRQ